MNLRILTYCCLAVMICTGFFTGCKFGEIKSVATTGELKMDVDENVVPLMKDEIKEFERMNPEAKVIMTAMPTNNAIVNLINGDTKFIVVSRMLNDEEKALLQRNKMELKEYPIAIDGIGFIVNLSNPVSRVTSDDLKKILSGEYKNWTDIKSQDEKQNTDIKKFFAGKPAGIKVFIQRKNSSTYKFVQDSILRELQYSAAAAVCSTSTQMLNSVRENDNAIGIINMNWLTKGNQDTIDSTVKTLRVSKIRENGFQEDFAEFHQGLLYSGSYPYRRTISVMTTEVDIKLATGFITFLTKTDGQKIVLKNSLVPVTQPVRTIQLN